MAGEDAVMGAAIGYRAEQLAPFLRTLRAAGFDGEVVLFVDDALARELRGSDLGEGVTACAVAQSLPFRLGWIRRPKLLRRVWLPVQTVLFAIHRIVSVLPLPDRLRERAKDRLFLLLHTPMEARFLLFRRALQEGRYEHVLISDVRDVVFQANPFETLPTHGLSVGIEVDDYTIGSEPHNALWMRRLYGEQGLRQTTDRPVSCVGVTYGDRVAMGTYLDAMVRELEHLPPWRVGIGGADTAVHNMLLWRGDLGEVHPQRPLQSQIGTMNAVAPESIRRDERGRVLNEQGTVVSVLHQYDRVRGLPETLLRVLMG